MEKLYFALSEMLPSLITALVFFAAPHLLKGQVCDIADGRIGKQGKRGVSGKILPTIHCSHFRVYSQANRKTISLLSSSVIDGEPATANSELKKR